MNRTEKTTQLRGPLSVGQCFTLATIMEATAPKPGNIHRGADFEDSSYPDFLVAATLVGPIIDLAVELPLGQTILSAVAATQAAVATNTNLGTVLLLAPLAKVPRTASLKHGVVDVLANLGAQDAADVYEAIRLAQPGGLGNVESADVAGAPPGDLIAAMRLAAERDMIARQYAHNFQDVFETVVPWLARALESRLTQSESIVRVHLELMSRFPDSLIARRRGVAVAGQAAAMAAAVLAAGKPRDEAYDRGLADLDFWLRADGHARNPGTTADLVAAGLFVALRDEIIKPPFRLAVLENDEDPRVN
ncbi:MAG: triphosphoribosyl-dephospho-CoA synthase [Pirellulales bacterium]